mgnify:CR=1 FL=1
MSEKIVQLNEEVIKGQLKGESCRLKERKEFMRQKQQIVNTLFEQGNA